MIKGPSIQHHQFFLDNFLAITRSESSKPITQRCKQRNTNIPANCIKQKRHEELWARCLDGHLHWNSLQEARASEESLKMTMPSDSPQDTIYNLRHNYYDQIGRLLNLAHTITCILTCIKRRMSRIIANKAAMFSHLKNIKIRTIEPTSQLNSCIAQRIT